MMSERKRALLRWPQSAITFNRFCSLIIIVWLNWRKANWENLLMSSHFSSRGLCQQRIDLLLQARLGLVHALVAHRLVLAGVCLDLRSVDGHVAQLHQSSLGTKQQSLREKPRERLQMTLAELGDGGVVRVLVTGKITEGHVLECARLNL